MKLLDIVNDELEDIECFDIQFYNTNKRKIGIFKTEVETKSQSYFDYGYTRDCTGVTDLTKEVFNTIYKQNTVFKNLESVYGKGFVPVFTFYNREICMIAIYGNGSSYLPIIEGIDRIELDEPCSALLEHLVINAPNGIEIAKAPYNTKSIIIVAKAGAKIEINKPFMKKSSYPTDTLKYIDEITNKVAKKFNKNTRYAENIVIESLNNNVECRQSNIELYWHTASDPRLTITVVSGVQRIEEDFYYDSEIYIIGI